MSNRDVLYKLIDEEWEFRMRSNPLLATSCGDHRFNNRLPDIRPEALDDQIEHVRVLQSRLHTLDQRSFNDAERLDYDIFARELWMQIEEYRFGLHLMPVSRLSGFHIYLPDLPAYTPFNSRQDFDDYLTRLNGLGRYFDGQIALMRLGIARGLVPARAALQGILSTTNGHVVQNPSDSAFYLPFKNFPSTIPPAEQSFLCKNALRAISEVVVPAYQRLSQFLENEYMPSARQGTAASTLPDGQNYYAYAVQRYTTLPLTPQAVHEIGLQEVRRIRSEMEQVMRSTGFQGNFREFVDSLRQDPRFFVETPKELMKEVAFIMKRMDGELPRLFGRLPRTPYGLRQIPDYLAPNSTTAYYFPSSGDGQTAGYYYVNTFDLKSRPLYEIEALSFHEAVPGHHLQLALQMEMEQVPQFRRFADVTAFVEGWALYAERLGLEVGFYEDVYSNFGRLTFEIWRACRLVVDTGLHALHWTRQQAIDYMAENTALAMLNIANEVDRYIAWPGQALAYKMGELKITELRRHLEELYGDRFNLRTFHDRLLENGAIPLDALEAFMMMQSFGL